MKSSDQKLRAGRKDPLVIVVEQAGSKASARLRRVLKGADFVPGPMDLPRTAPEAVPDAVLVIDASRNTAEMASALGATRAFAARVVLITGRRDAGALVAALRAGVADVVALTDPDFEQAINDAVTRIWARVMRLAEKRAERRAVQAQRRSARTLRRRLLSQTQALCADLAHTCRGMGMELASVAMASEVNALFRQELDLEGLLRTTLEYTLRKVGPTNAVVFLRNTCEDFEVGAYANYDAPREASECMLDRLASTLPDVVGSESEPVRMDSADAIVGAVGTMPEGLGEAALMAVGCGVGREPGAVIALFRDRRQGFGDTAVRTLRIVGRAFGEQAVRIRQTQIRHLGSPDWLANESEG